MISTTFAVMAFVLQPLLALNIPSAFALGSPATLSANVPATADTCSWTAPYVMNVSAGNDVNTPVVATITLANSDPATLQMQWKNVAFGAGWNDFTFNSSHTATYAPGPYVNGFPLNDDHNTSIQMKFSSPGIYTYTAQFVQANNRSVVVGTPFTATTVVSRCAVSDQTSGVDFNNIQSALNAAASNDVIALNANIVVGQQATITKPVTVNGNGHTITAGFDSTYKNYINNSVLSPQSDGVTINNLVVDGAGRAYLHGINVTSGSTIINVALNNVVVENNTQSGLNVGQNSHVTATSITTKSNGWDGIDVDKADSVLTLEGTNSQTEVGPDVKVDDTTAGKVVDHSGQYGSVDLPNGTATMRLYNIMLAAPQIISPTNNTYTSNNKFDNVFTKVTGAAKYQYETQYGAGRTYSDNGTYDQSGANVVRHNGASPDATYTWRVRAIDAYGVAGKWSNSSTVTVDTTTPSVPTATLQDQNAAPVAMNGSTSSKHFTFTLSSSSDVTRYQLQYWNNISGDQFNGQAKAWTLSNTMSYSTSPAQLSKYVDQFTRGEGTHYFAFSACNAAGTCSAFSSPFTVTYDTTAPQLTITSYVANGDGTYTISGTTDNSANVTVKVGSVILAPVTPTNGAWTVTTTDIADGTYTVTASSTDAAGNVGTSTSSASHTFSTPISKTQQSDGVLPAVKSSTTPAAALAVRTNNNGQAVLGDQTAGKTTVPGVSDQSVKGVNTTRKDANSGAVALIGFAWYWWLIAAVAVGLAWWLIAARRRRNQAE